MNELQISLKLYRSLERKVVTGHQRGSFGRTMCGSSQPCFVVKPCGMVNKTSCHDILDIFKTIASCMSFWVGSSAPRVCHQCTISTERSVSKELYKVLWAALTMVLLDSAVLLDAKNYPTARSWLGIIFLSFAILLYVSVQIDPHVEDRFYLNIPLYVNRNVVPVACTEPHQYLPKVIPESVAPNIWVLAEMSLLQCPSHCAVNLFPTFSKLAGVQCANETLYIYELTEYNGSRALPVH